MNGYRYTPNKGYTIYIATCLPTGEQYIGKTKADKAELWKRFRNGKGYTAIKMASRVAEYPEKEQWTVTALHEHIPSANLAAIYEAKEIWQHNTIENGLNGNLPVFGQALAGTRAGEIIEALNDDDLDKLIELQYELTHPSAQRTAKAVWQLDKEMNPVKLYPSILEASMQTGIDQGNISRAAAGIRHTAAGYTWVYDQAVFHLMPAFKEAM